MCSAERKTAVLKRVLGTLRLKTAVGFVALFSSIFIIGFIFVLMIEASCAQETDVGHYRSVIFTFGATFTLFLVAGSLFGWWMSGGFVRGVTRVTAAAQKIADGDFSRRVKHGNEGSEIDTLVDAFNRMACNTENVIRELRTLTDDIAHDLKTPITRLRARTELAVRRPNDPDLPADIMEECDDMLTMISSMLEISKTENGLVRYSVQAEDVGEFLSSVADLYRPLLSERKLVFDLKIPDVPTLLTCSRTQLQHAVSNLLDNAIKFTPAGGTVTLAATRGTGGTVRISVSDTGSGISETDLPRIFDRFYRSDKSRHIPGNGLGLSLAKALVAANRGTIETVSSPAGTTFTLVFPQTGRTHR